MSETQVKHPIFLLDFCQESSLLQVMVIAELLAIVLVLASWPAASFWHTLALTSLFVQWIALASAAVLCRLRSKLATQHPLRVAWVAYGVVLGITLMFSVMTVLLLGHFVHSEAGDFTHDLDFMFRNALISTIVAAVALRYFYLLQAWKRSLEARADARLRALQARIRPHFLFNSMNTIAALIHLHPGQAEQAIEDLADMFRAVISDKDASTLGAEITLARQYLALEQLRLGERLQVRWQIDLDQRDHERFVPPLILQPLVENAIYHGIQLRPEGGVISLRLWQAQGYLQIVVENPIPSGTKGPRHEGQGIALNNIRERLEIGYPGARMQLQFTSGGCIVQLELPLGESHAYSDRG